MANMYTVLLVPILTMFVSILQYNWYEYYNIIYITITLVQYFIL